MLRNLATVALIAWSATLTTASQQPRRNALEFDPASYTTVHITVDGAPMEVRRYRVIYVAKPVKIDLTAVSAPAGGPGGTPNSDPYAYQSMNIYVPQSAYQDVNAAIVLQVNNGGFLASPAAERIVNSSSVVGTNDTDNTGAALKAGYVVINAGTRSRGIKDEQGTWAGKAPAFVVDAKAAIRYLRYNDAVMPGSAERIVITGTSGGGALSVAVASSGNSPDYYPDLAAIGAAGIDANGRSTVRDDVFATIAYCPITDLAHADFAYEWQYTAVRTDANTQRGVYPAAMHKASTALAAAYPAYLKSLNLTLEDGRPLTAETMDDAIVAQVKRETEEAIAAGVAIPALGAVFVLNNGRDSTTVRNDWLNVANGKVVEINYTNYLRFVATARALKVAPAFDSGGNSGNQVSAPENALFGNGQTEFSNFTEYGWNNNDVKGDRSGPDDTGKNWAQYRADPSNRIAEQLTMLEPLPYLSSSADSAPYWYIRHGMLDRDTSFAVGLALYHAVRKDPTVKDVSFQLTWLRPHSGNYDVQEAYGWLASALAKAGDPGARR